MMMFIGGAMGSAAGGVKVNRIILAYEGVKWWFRRFFVSSHVLVPLRFGRRILSKEISEMAISRNLLVIVVYVLTIFVATIVSLHLYITSFGLDEVIFELVSALSECRAHGGVHLGCKSVLDQMDFYPADVAGETRDIPVIIIAMGLAKGIEEDITKQKPAPLVYDHHDQY